MNAIRFTCIALLAVGVAGCGKQSDEPTTPATPAASEGAPAPAAADMGSAVALTSLQRSVVADGVPFQPAAATVDGDALHSTGTAGFVMFGPYVPFAAGDYRVHVVGSIAAIPENGQVHFDVASGKGSSVHGEASVASTAPEGVIAEFNVHVPTVVSDLEVRASVPDGVDMRIQSYSVTPAE